MSRREGLARLQKPDSILPDIEEAKIRDQGDGNGNPSEVMKIIYSPGAEPGELPIEAEGSRIRSEGEEAGMIGIYPILPLLESIERER